MAKPNKGKGKSSDGHKIGKTKRGKPTNEHTAGKSKHGKMAFKSKPKKFAGKKTKNALLKGKKYIGTKNESDQKSTNEGKSIDKKRKGETPGADGKPIKVKRSDTMVTPLMTIYETLRRKNTSNEDRSRLVNEVLEICADKENEVIHKHDTVRVLEMCVKYGNETQREKLFEVFDKNLMELVTSKYAKFLIQKFIEYGSKEQKKKIIESFYGHMKKLIRNKGASSIVDDIYDRYASPSQKVTLAEEFYGPEIIVYKAASGLTADDIIKNEPTKKAAVLKYMKEQLDTLCQKDVISHSIIHRVLYNFFSIASDSDKSDVISLLKEKIVHILHTRDGANVAMNCIWFSNAKDRKAIVKSFKTYMVKICKEEYGHLVMLALLDVVDDTVLLKKILFPEIISKLEELILNMYGRKVILYLLKARSPSYFSPDIIKILQQGDENAHSKKEKSVREKELRDAILPNLLDVMRNQLKDVLFNKSAAIVLLAILDVSYELDQSVEVLKELARIVGKPIKSSTEDEEKEEEHPICDACGHWVIKRVIQQDKNRKEKGMDILFSDILCDAVPTGCFADWASSNRGAFVLVSLLETDVESVTSRVKEDLQFIKTTQSSKGLDVLKKLLST